MRLLPSDNSGGYSITYLPKQQNDSLCIEIKVFDLNTKQEINDGLFLNLFEDVKISTVFKGAEREFLIEKPFFTISAFGYKPIVTKPIFFSKSNQIKLNVFLAPNSNSLRD